MVLYRSAVDASITRDARGIGNLAILPCCDFEKARERSQVACQRLKLDLLNKIGIGVRPKVVLRSVGGNRHRQHAETQCPLGIDLEGELCRYQGKHGYRDRPARQQIGAAAVQLARARSR